MNCWAGPQRRNVLTSSFLGRLWIFAPLVLIVGTLTLGACGRSELYFEPAIAADGGSVDSGEVVDGSADRIVKISVIPAAITLPAGAAESVRAQALYVTGATADVTGQVVWTSDAPAIADIDASGKVTAKASGVTSIRATLRGVSGVATVTVPRAALASIQVSPAAAATTIGGTQQFQATAIYADMTFSDVTLAVLWSTGDPAVAKVDSTGRATGIGSGTTRVQAALLGKTGSATLTVSSKTIKQIQISPFSPTVGIGIELKLAATAIYTDSTTADVSTSATWTSSNPGNVTVVSGPGIGGGQATGVRPGTAVITATVGGVSGSTTVTVPMARLVGISIAPASSSIPVGGSATFTATARYADGSSSDATMAAVWSSSDPVIAVAAAGVATGIGTGTATISASFGGITGSASLTVTGSKLLAILISPANSTLPMGSPLTFRADGSYADGSTTDITNACLWATGTDQVVTVSNGAGSNGRVSTVAPGTDRVTCTLAGVTGQATITVTSATIVSMVLAPNPLAVTVGSTAQAKATATYSDGSMADVTTVCTWSTSATMIAVASNGAGVSGQVTGVAAGTATVSCQLGNIIGSLQVIVTATMRQLVTITVAPPATTLPVGAVQQLVATALYSDGSMIDVTAGAMWNSDAEGVATVDATGKVVAVAPGVAHVSATLGAISGQSTVTVPQAVLSSIALSPNPATTAVGGAVKFAATATYSDGTKSDVTAVATWTIDDPAIAAITSNVATGISPGATNVHATVGSVSASASLTVTSVPLKSLAISPLSPKVGLGASIGFTVTATYADGSSANVTVSSSWLSSNTTVATIVAGGALAGNADAVGPGTATISAAFGGLTASTTMTVTAATLVGLTIVPPSATVSIGNHALLAAFANYSDGTMVDVTSSAIWTTNNPAIATVSTGNVTGVAAGMAVISASFGAQSASATITVSSATLLAISISPSNPTAALKTTINFTAKGSYSDGTTQDVTTSVTWSTSQSSIATISNGAGSQGQAIALGAGTTSITATLGPISASTNLTVVNANIVSIAIQPNPATLVQGDKILLTAQATLRDGSISDITAACNWSSNDTGIATVSNGSGSQGQVTAIGLGTTTIQCTQSGISGTASVTVTAATTAQVNVTPIAPTCHVGDVLQFTAMAISTGGSSQNVTNNPQTTWSSSNPGVLQPVLGGPKSRFKCLAKGQAVVSATYLGVTGTTTVTVSDAVVVSIIVDPAGSSIPVGWTQQYQASAIYSDGTSTNVTGLATWLSTDLSVASVSTGGARGRATGLTPGSTTIQATYAGVTGSTGLTVSTAVVTSLSLNPESRSAPPGTKFQYTAQAIYSDGTSRDVTGLATWISSNPGAASVSDAAGKGQCTTFTAGTVTITATYAGVSGIATLVVTSATLVDLQVTPPDPKVAAGIPVFLRATAVYSDGTSIDVTGAATWTSGNTAVATVSDAGGSKGLAMTVKPGTATIKALYSGVQGSSMLTVTAATITNVQVTPFKPSVPVGYGIQLVATAVYSDGSTVNVTGIATWTTNDVAVAAVSDAAGSKGRVNPLASGNATISATWNGVTGTDSIMVTSAVLTSIVITPNPGSVAIGGHQALVATGGFSDGSTLDVTTFVGWSSSATSIADVSNATGTKGIVYGFATGTVTVTATRNAVTASVPVSVQ
jgi:hypothetical protein